MARYEVRISGFGGQGVIMAGYVIGKAAAVFENRHATFNQSYGPEARGSACSAQVIISDEPITYPYLRTTDVLIAMSQEGYRQHHPHASSDGRVLIDVDLVTPDPAATSRPIGIPATRIAEQLGKRIMANMVMIGCFAAATRIVAADAIRDAVRTSVPSGTEELNLAALERGLTYAAPRAGELSAATAERTVSP